MPTFTTEVFCFSRCPLAGSADATDIIVTSHVTTSRPCCCRRARQHTAQHLASTKYEQEGDDDIYCILRRAVEARGSTLVEAITY